HIADGHGLRARIPEMPAPHGPYANHPFRQVVARRQVPLAAQYKTWNNAERRGPNHRLFDKIPTGGVFFFHDIDFSKPVLQSQIYYFSNQTKNFLYFFSKEIHYLQIYRTTNANYPN